MEGSDSNEEFASELTKTELRFGFDDGVVTSICNHEDEPIWVTNFKRGVLSMFQNTMTSLHEDEVR